MEQADRQRWRQGIGTVLVAIGALAAGGGSRAADGPATAAPRPVLLELFTSQGCSSCPPADALLRELAARDDVLALGYHVDYWDSLGWPDPFASPQFTARQQRYARRQEWQLFTPQLVIDGRQSIIGSQRSQALAGIAAARIGQAAAATSILRQGSAVQVAVGTVAAPEAGGEVWLLSFDAERVTEIGRGENAGRRIAYPNVVRSRRLLGRWHNEALTLAATLQPDERGERLALLVQDDLGRVWALAATPSH